MVNLDLIDKEKQIDIIDSCMHNESNTTRKLNS